MGLDIFLFTPEDVQEKKQKIRALFYEPASRKWQRKWTAFPDIVFDRCRYQPTVRFQLLRKFREKYPHLLYLNRPLANKWKIFQLLNRSPALRKSLPFSEQVTNSADIFRFLQKMNSAYLKPINGTGGRGILRIRREGDQYVLSGRDHKRRIIPAQKLGKAGVARKFAKLQARKPYMIQQEIDCRLPSGQVHDFRLLIQKNGSGEWRVTGCAGRIGAPRSVTSNLHGGGRAVPRDKLLSMRFPENKISPIVQSMEDLAFQVTAELEKHYHNLCELALDIAVDRTGHPWLLEINPKPSREIFRKIGDQNTYREAIRRPLEYAVWLYGSRAKPAGT